MVTHCAVLFFGAARRGLKRGGSGGVRVGVGSGSTVEPTSAFPSPPLVSSLGVGQKQLVEMDSDFQQKRREFQEDLNNRKNEELQKLLDRANRVVIQIAKAEHYDVILQEAVYVDRRLDITDKVIAGLNATSGN